MQDIEVVIDWSSAVMWGAIKMSNSPVGVPSEFPCPPEYVDQGMSRAGKFLYVRVHRHRLHYIGITLSACTKIAPRGVTERDFIVVIGMISLCPRLHVVKSTNRMH